jgi:hypothetical protein
VGETRVDLVHLLEDLRDAYPGSLEETILTEILANALDSGARTLHLESDPATATLIAVDDGKGMSRRELARYHDLGTSTKRRGKGIGFAGVGIKLGLLACTEVITETRRGTRQAATSWRLAHRTRAPWSWIEPPHLLDADGTAVLLRLSNPLSELLDPGFLEATAIRHFQPLFEPEFLEILAAHYPDGFSILVNRTAVVGPIRPAARDPLAIRIGRQRKPSAIGYLARHEQAIPEHERGLAISTLGKVIRRGWDWLGLTPADADRIEGLIEVPQLADALTLNKGDFLRHGTRGALFISYRKAIQEAVAARLEAWGAAPPPPPRKTGRTRPFERDLRKVLGDMAEEYPVLAALADRRSGGQRRLPLGGPAAHTGVGARESTAAAGTETGAAAETAEAGTDTATAGTGTAGTDPATAGTATGAATAGDTERGAPDPPPASERGDGTGRAPDEAPGVRLPGSSRRKRPATLSLEIRFESRPEDVQLGRLQESAVWVNDAHPAYRRAVASRAEGYHLALTVAASLAPLTVEPADTQDFVNRFLARWGEAVARNGR